MTGTKGEGSGAEVGGVEVDASGMWVASSLGFSFHCDCGWVSKRYDSDSEAIDAEVWPHMADNHRADSDGKGIQR